MCDLENEFQQLKNEYSCVNKNASELIEKMRQNLKARLLESELQYETGIQCLDGKLHRLDSDDVTDLYAIDSYLSAQKTSEQMTKVGEEARSNMEKQNKYSPSNPYGPRSKQ